MDNTKIKQIAYILQDMKPGEAQVVGDHMVVVSSYNDIQVYPLPEANKIEPLELDDENVFDIVLGRLNA